MVVVVVVVVVVGGGLGDRGDGLDVEGIAAGAEGEDVWRRKGLVVVVVVVEDRHDRDEGDPLV